MFFKLILNQALIGCRNRKLLRNFGRLASQAPNKSKEMSSKKKSEAASSEAEKPQTQMKYILVTGGVISGIGKGVVASSFGTLLNCCGISVTSLKIDPYINIDAGTFSPYEHGKNFDSFLSLRMQKSFQWIPLQGMSFS